MDSNPDRRAVVVASVVGLAISAVGLYFGTGLHPVWRLIWAAPIPVLMVAHRARWSIAFAAGFVVWFLGSLNMWAYLHDEIHVPAVVVAAFMAIPSASFGLAALLSRALVRRERVWEAAFALPVFWVAVEFLVSIVSPHGTFGSLAYTQMDFLPVVQLASVFGVLGVSFLVLLVPSTVAVVLSGAGSPRSRVGVGVVSAVLVLAALGFGLWRLSLPPSGTSAVKIGLAAADQPASALPASDPAARDVLAAYAASLDALGEQEVRVAVLPETIVAVSDAYVADVETLFEDVAARRSMTIVVGLDRVSDGVERNTALVFRPGDVAPPSYEKHHLIPGGEAQYEPGSGLTVLDGSRPSWGVAICKDLDFPALSRQYGEQSIGLLLVPAWDFDRDAWLHSRMAVMRGVESGFAVARSARRGALTISDMRGRVIAETSSDSARVATVTGWAPKERVETIYQRFGDWFGWLCAAAAVALVGRAVVRPKQYRER